jgi:hypothetical protein
VHAILLARVMGIGVETADMLVQEVLSRNLREATDAEPGQIRLMIRLCSPTRLSRSRLGRLASSSLIVGIATILQ